MKKKTIEKIPYLKLPSVICKKDVKYVGVTAVKVIGHEKHLFLEVYQNKKTSMETPLVRSGSWSRKRILVHIFQRMKAGQNRGLRRAVAGED